MKSVLNTLVLLSLSLLPLVSVADTPIFEATYKGKYGSFSIVTLRRLTQLDDNTYKLESTASNFFGSLNETSHFKKLNGRWTPLSYSYTRKILGVEAVESLDFDWDTQTATYRHSRKPELSTEHEIEPGMLDPALYLLRLQQDLVQGKDDLSYTFVKRDRIRHYDITASKTEPVRLKDEDYAAIKLHRDLPADEKNTFVWAIPELKYVFGKITHVEDEDDSHDMVMTRYQRNEDALQAFFTSADEPAARAAAE